MVLSMVSSSVLTKSSKRNSFYPDSSTFDLKSRCFYPDWSTFDLKSRCFYPDLPTLGLQSQCFNLDSSTLGLQSLLFRRRTPIFVIVRQCFHISICISISFGKRGAKHLHNQTIHLRVTTPCALIAENYQCPPLRE